MAHVVCGGLVCMDFFFKLVAFPIEGTKNRAVGAAMVPGGGALIAASAIAALGGRVSLVGAVGDDALGQSLRAALVERGIGDRLRHAPVGTARSAVMISPGGARTVVNHRDDALFEVFPDLPSRFDAALVDTRWPGGSAEVLRAARRLDKPAVLDAEAPVRLAMDAVHAASHIVFSEQGLRDFAGASDETALRQVARDLGVWVAVTRGPAPVMCCDGSHLFEVPGFPARVVDTLGAGDVWHGAFTLGLAQGLKEAAAVRRANAAAALKVGWRAGRFATDDDVAALIAS